MQPGFNHRLSESWPKIYIDLIQVWLLPRNISLHINTKNRPQAFQLIVLFS